MHHVGRRHLRRMLPALAAVAALTAAVAGTSAAGAPSRVLVPIGSDYQAPTMQRFAQAAARADTTGRVLLLVLPITYSRNAYESTNGERQQNLTLATARGGLLQDACVAVKAPAQTCETRVVPVLTRPDAYLAANVAAFTADVDGLYILGGDQTVAMQVVAGTPVEDAMAAAYARGAVVGGNSAGDAVQSRTMINGYTGANGPAESLRQGAVDIWSYDGPGDETRGLVFGLANAVDEQHIYEYGRFGRAVNVAFTTGLPVVGMDAATGGVIVDERTLTDVVGFTSGAVVDPVTWGATGGFAGPTATLSVRRMAAHLLPPGGYGYDLASLRPTAGGQPRPAPSIAGRTYPSITTPAGAGPLLVAGGIVGRAPGAVTSRFGSLAGGAGARVVVLAAGYAKSSDAQADAKALATALQPGVAAPVAWIVLDGKTDQAAVAAAVRGATGVLLTAPDRSAVMAAFRTQQVVISAVRSAWLGGATLLADDAAGAALGTRFVADPPPGADVESLASEDFLAAGVTVATGLGWLGGATVQPRLLPDQEWGQLWHLVSDVPGTLAVGVDVATALEVRSGSATVRGDSVAVVLDGRKAAFGSGTNGAMAARWVALDTFVDGERLAP
jgi:cyanophycinase-like exopeptidase